MYLYLGNSFLFINKCLVVNVIFVRAEGDGTLYYQFVYVIVKVSGYVDNDDYVLDVGISYQY